MKRGSAFIALALSMALLFTTACSSAGGSSAASNTASGAASGTASATASNAPKSGGTLKIGTSISLTVAGNTPKITANSMTQFLRIVFDSLLFYDNDGKLVADLAEKWETDPSAKTITFHLRSGVKFSDGTDFNAEAVKWNIEQYQAAKRSETSNIASVGTPDANTVVLTLKAWDSSTLTSVGYFVYYMSPTAAKAHDAAWLDANAVGTGPFILKQWNKGVSEKYEKNPTYWRGQTYLDGIDITEITDTMTLESTLQAGEIDLISYADIGNVKDLDGNDKYIRETNENGVGVEGFGIIPNSADSKSPFSNVKVRQALCYAIDSDSIIKTLGYGYMTTTNQWAAPGAATFNKDVQGYPYNPEKAKQLLAEAGYPNGFDTVLYSVSSGLYADTCTAVAQELTNVGIRAKIEVADGTKTNSMMTNGWDGLMLHFNSIGPDLGLFMGRHLDPTGAFFAKGIQHPQDALDLLAKIRTATDDKSKLEDSMKLQKLIYDTYALFGKPMAVQSINTVKYKYVMDDNYTAPNAAAWTPWTAWLNK